MGWRRRSHGKTGGSVGVASDTYQYPQVCCVILNWNGWRDTIGCLDSLKSCDYPAVKIIVVDNGSTNDSVASISAAHPDILLLQSGQNLGFAYGNNIGIRWGLEKNFDYFWLLNNDTTTAPEALCALIAKAESDRKIGAVASISYFASAPDRIEAWAGGRVNLWTGFVENTRTPHDDDWFEALYGASMLVSAEALKDAGLLDEGFFLYLEETELCLRLRKKGWRLAAAPNSRIWHKVNGSTGGNPYKLDRLTTASKLRILKLHAPVPALTMLVYLLLRFGKRLIRFQFSRMAPVFAGIRDYLAMRPIKQRIR